MSNAPIEINNSFLNYKSAFKTDTGLEFNEANMALYIQYVTARSADYTAQVVHGLTHQLLNKVDFLPGQIRTQIAEMITSHPLIKELLNKRP